jgi:hypothetical protein
VVSARYKGVLCSRTCPDDDQDKKEQEAGVIYGVFLHRTKKPAESG